MCIKDLHLKFNSQENRTFPMRPTNPHLFIAKSNSNIGEMWACLPMPYQGRAQCRGPCTGPGTGGASRATTRWSRPRRSRTRSSPPPPLLSVAPLPDSQSPVEVTLPLNGQVPESRFQSRLGVVSSILYPFLFFSSSFWFSVNKILFFFFSLSYYCSNSPTNL